MQDSLRHQAAGQPHHQPSARGEAQSLRDREILQYFGADNLSELGEDEGWTGGGGI